MFGWWRRQAGRREKGGGRGRRESKSGVRGESNSRRGRRRKGESGGRVGEREMKAREVRGIRRGGGKAKKGKEKCLSIIY